MFDSEKNSYRQSLISAKRNKRVELVTGRLIFKGYKDKVTFYCIYLLTEEFLSFMSYTPPPKKKTTLHLEMVSNFPV